MTNESAGKFKTELSSWVKSQKKKKERKKSIFPAVNNTARACDTTSLKAFITPMTQRSTGVNVKEHALFNGVERPFLFCG